MVGFCIAIAHPEVFASEPEKLRPELRPVIRNYFGSGAIREDAGAWGKLQNNSIYDASEHWLITYCRRNT